MQAVSTAGTSQMYAAGVAGQVDAASAAATTEIAAEVAEMEIHVVLGEKGYDPIEDTVEPIEVEFMEAEVTQAGHERSS
eukprot:4347146-Amphidinium_carterae.1